MINSDKQVAQNLATGLMSALDTLNQSATVTKDTQTTINGNTTAHETSDDMLDIASKISQTISSASENLNSVAGEFEAIDRVLRDAMRLFP